MYKSYNSRLKVAVTPTKTSPTTQTSPTMRPTLKHCLIQSNISHSCISQIHVNTWEYKDHAEWMDQIHPGDQIAVHAIGGEFESNIVDFVQIDIYYAC